MSAPLFFTRPGALHGAGPGDLVLLDGPEGRHAVEVTRLTAGEEVLLSDGTGRMARTEVAQTRRGEADLRIVDTETVSPTSPRFTLVQALAKHDRDLLAIEVGTELGVDEVVPWQADRSIVRWRGERAAKAHRKWEQTVLAATKQARRPVVPVVTGLADRQAVADRVRAADLALVLHEKASEPLAGLDLPTTGEVLLVVGPEGGITPEETAAFVGAGALTVRLGSTVLRTSTAGAAAVALLSARTRWR